MDPPSELLILPTFALPTSQEFPWMMEGICWFVQAELDVCQPRNPCPLVV